MPVIPTVVSQEDTRVGGIDVYANPNQAGAQIGRALQGLGGAVEGLSGAVARYDEENKRRKTLDDRLAVANGVAQTDLGKVAFDVESQAPADGKGIAQSTFEKQKEYIDKYADENYTDDTQRKQYKLTMYQKLPGWRDRANANEFSQRDKYNRDQTNNSINALVNKVRADPMQYDQSILDANKLIDAGSYTAEAKATMHAQLRSDIAGARFEAFAQEANSDDDFVRLEHELKNPDWQKDMTQQEFERTTQMIKTSHNAFLTGQDAQARSMLDSAETRSKAREAIPDAELQEMGTFARNARSPAITARYLRLIAQQDLLRNFGKASPSQIDQGIKTLKGSDEVKGAVGQWASDASQATGGEIPASYLINKLGIEYSAEDIKQGRFNEPNKAGTSSARGLYQFVDGTWISMMRKYGARVGYADAGKMDPGQLLALRGDPALNTKMAAFYALENKRAMQSAGISPTDTDLYLAHFLGAGGAIDFIRAMRSDPTGSVRPFGNFTNDQIRANLPVFMHTVDGRGMRLSFKQVYDNLSAKMLPGTSAAKFDNIQYLETIRDNKRQAIATDPIVQYQADGKMGDYQLDSYTNMATRGADAAGAANYYDVPIDEMKPLTADEAQQIKKNFSDGSADTQMQALQVLAGLDAGSPGMFKAALNQIGEKESVVGYAGSLAFDKGEQATAAQILRGNKILQTDKTLASTFEGGTVAQTFYDTVGSSLSGMTPAMRDAIFNAAKAHYAETYASRGNLQFNANQFETSVKAVLGNSSGEALGQVNNAITVLPPGVSEDAFESALNNMTDADVATMSLDHTPPKDLYGETVPAKDIADEGAFIWVGADSYKIRMSDGNYLTTGDTDPNAPYNMKAFVFVAKPQAMLTLAGRAERNFSPDTYTTKPEDDLSMQGGAGLGGIAPPLKGEYQ